MVDEIVDFLGSLRSNACMFALPMMFEQSLNAMWKYKNSNNTTNPVMASGARLTMIGFHNLGHAMLIALFERWHEKTSNFHLSLGGDDHHAE